MAAAKSVEEINASAGVVTPQLEQVGRMDSQLIALEQGYAALLDEQRKLMPEIPDVSVRFKDLSYTLHLPKKMHSMPNVAKAALKTASFLWPGTWYNSFRPKSERKDLEPFHVLHQCTGELLPGRTALLLAPPGHGKTSLMRTLAGLVNQKNISGEIRYSGVSQSELSVSLSKMIAYVSQLDIHMPQLTVRETFQFAKDAMLVNSHHYDDHALAKAAERRVETFIKLLGLESCADTIVGNEIFRGVSGGQKKRVTLGEMLISNARVLLMDEVSTGLDSAVTLDIMRSIRTWARKMNGTVLTALLQPPIDVYELFDDLLLLREGHIVYQGPREHVFEYLSKFGISEPTDMDHADFLTEFLTDPVRMWRHQHCDQVSENPDNNETSCGEDRDGSMQPDLSTQALARAWHQNRETFLKSITSSIANAESVDTSMEKSMEKSGKPGEENRIETELSIVGDTTREVQNKMQYNSDEHSLELTSGFARAQYGNQFAHSLTTLTKLCLQRQIKLMFRNPLLIGSRVAQAIVIGLVLGSVFWSLGLDDFNLKFGVMLFVAVFLAFANMAEVPVAIEARNVVQKQTAAGFYPTLSYGLSVTLTHLPVAFLETLIFSAILYFMVGFTDNAGQFFFFVLVLFVHALAMSSAFRTVAYASPNMEIAQVFAGPLTGCLMMFGGFLITKNGIPLALRWLYWILPFSWTVRSLAQNEMLSDRYAISVPNTDLTFGELGLKTFEYQTDDYYKWTGIGVIFGYYVFLTVIMILILAYKRLELHIGTSRSNSEDDTGQTTQDAGSKNMVKVSPADESTASSMPFDPMTLAFDDIKYEVQLPDKSWKKLLCGVSGVAAPYTMTALMGESGAGKTTLMDVIAGRKTAGRMHGRIFVNGFEKEHLSFARVTGYVEQNDIHMQYMSVKESLLFAAELRLPSTVTSKQREIFVNEVMVLMELDELADRMVGAVGEEDGGLAPGQRKRLTIAVELVANPSILFLDEPTSGLDSRAALSVMRVVRNIASTGRTVVCTIHQPSAELFTMFDNLLLLKAGGHQVYAGPIGNKAATLKTYFISNGAESCSNNCNPADWMLDQLGVGNNGHSLEDAEAGVKNLDFAQIFQESQLKVENDETVSKACVLSDNSKKLAYDTLYARSKWVQFKALMWRTGISYWRNASYNWTRIFVLMLVGLLFGCLYYNARENADDLASVLSVIALILVGSMFGAYVMYSTVLPVVAKERAVYYRERSANMYSSSMYSLALTLTEIPYVAVVATCFTILYYFLTSMANDTGIFFHHLFIQFLISLSMCYWGMLFAAVISSVEVAQLAGSAFVMPFFLFGGVFVPYPDIPDGWIWMYYLNPVAHATKVMAALQLYCEGDNCPTMTITSPSGNVQTVDRYEFVKSTYEFDYDQRWEYTGYLVLFIVVFRILGIIALKKINHMKR